MHFTYCFHFTYNTIMFTFFIFQKKCKNITPTLTFIIISLYIQNRVVNLINQSLFLFLTNHHRFILFLLFAKTYLLHSIISFLSINLTSITLLQSPNNNEKLIYIFGCYFIKQKM